MPPTKLISGCSLNSRNVLADPPALMLFGSGMRSLPGRRQELLSGF